MSSILNKIQSNELVKFYTIYNMSEGVDTVENDDLVSMFLKSSIKHPESTAIIYDNRKITYKELDQATNKICHYLQEKNVSFGEAVIVDADQSPESIAAAIGIMRAGAVYVPVDHNYPDYRKEYIREHSGAKISLTKESVNSIVQGDSVYEKTSNVILKKNDTAYVIYTSGTTGNPKGVVISHGAAANTIKDIVKRFEFSDQDRVICLSSFGFDLSIFDIFGTLYCGATIVIAGDYRNFDELHKIAVDNHITVWNSVPSTMNAYLHYLGDNINNRNMDMRIVMLSGDWIPLKLPELIKSHMPNAKCVSLGGATEAGIWSIYYEIGDIDPNWNSIPYGMPLTNQSIYILNSHGTLCPIGVQGDIYIGGDSLADGYYHDKELTDNAFSTHSEFGRIYRTGDTGIMHKEGYVEFTGRTDSQVKINGYRIELSEIEKCLEKDSEVDQVIAICDRRKEAPVIRAYIKRKSGKGDNDAISKYKNLILEELPTYMVPASFVEVDEFPVTFNGKVDRKALLEIETQSEKSQDEYHAPQGKIEKMLSEIIESELEDQRSISRDENLYLLGIDSIHMMNIINKVQDSFEIVINYHDFMKVNTLEEFAAYIEKYVDKNMIEHKDIEDNDELLYWSGLCDWYVRDDRIYLSNVSNGGYPKDFWFEIYQFMQTGHKKNEIREIFKKYNLDDTLFNEFLESRVITDEIIRPDELFKSQDKYIESDYMFQLNREIYDDFKKKQLKRETYSEEGISFNKYISKDIPMVRKSIRLFDESTQIQLKDFAQFMSLLRQGTYEGKVKYYYPSAGGFYPIDTYVAIRENRIEGIEKGLYYYNPIKNNLCRIGDDNIIEDFYYFNNKKIAKTSAFSMFFVFNAHVTFPNYGYMAYYYACLDTGIMTELMNEKAGNYNLGVCSIGDFNAQELKKMLRLPKNHILMHAIEGGIPQ